jgi:hypothetical protein
MKMLQKRIVATLSFVWLIIGGIVSSSDYHSDYEGMSPSGNREWGIVNENCKLKPACEQVENLFLPVHALTETRRTT